MELVRVVEPGIVCLHALGDNSLSGKREEAVLDFAYSGALHDLGMHYILRLFTKLIRLESNGLLCHRICLSSCRRHMFFKMVPVPEANVVCQELNNRIVRLTGDVN